MATVPENPYIIAIWTLVIIFWPVSELYTQTICSVCATLKQLKESSFIALDIVHIPLQNSVLNGFNTLAHIAVVFFLMMHLPSTSADVSPYMIFNFVEKLIIFL